MAVQRKPLQKAPQRDVVDAFTTPPAEVIEHTRPETRQPETREESSTPRRGPGRPRSKKRMEQLASKIDIELRDQMDAYLSENGMTVVDFLDEAIRDKLRKDDYV